MNTTTDINDGLKASYLLLTISTRKWNARRPDQALAVELAAAHGGDAQSFSGAKKLMVGCPEYKSLDKAINACRSYIYNSTAPWSNAGNGKAMRGPRIALATRVLEIMAHMKGLQDTVDDELAALKAVYPQRVQMELSRQGTAADPTQYPDVSELDELFGVTLDIEPVPTVGDFTNMALPAQLTQFLGDRMAKRQSAVVENAMGNMFTRMIDSVGNMAEVLAVHGRGEKTKLYATLVTNVQEVGRLMRDCNFSNNPDIDALCDTLDQLSAYDIGQIKASQSTAADLSVLAREAVDKAMVLSGRKPAVVKEVPPPKELPVSTPDADVPIAAPVTSASMALDDAPVVQHAFTEEPTKEEDDDVADLLAEVDIWFND